MLSSILTGAGSSQITVNQFLTCTAASLILGGLLACIHIYKNQYSKNFIITLILLPAVVQSVIMIVNGNLGTGVAVMGTFSLVRFRSVPGNSREIGSVFLAMAIGLSTGMGYLAIGILLLAASGTALFLSAAILFREGSFEKRELKITIPEDLDYTGIFDDIFQIYTKEARLMKVRTVNMGSLYELWYQIHLKEEKQEKEMLDAIRCRNGNLGIVCGRIPGEKEEL